MEPLTGYAGVGLLTLTVPSIDGGAFEVLVFGIVDLRCWFLVP